MTHILDKNFDVFRNFNFNSINLENYLFKDVHIEIIAITKVDLVNLFMFFKCFTKIFGFNNKNAFVTVNSLSFADIYLDILSFDCIIISFF